jgi:ribosomal protein L3 glutamine methyltransferase
VDERVIVPRSYIGEILDDPALIGPGGALVPDPDRVAHVLDLCTGSGCLAILAALTFPNAMIDAADLSRDALDVARINVVLTSPIASADRGDFTRRRRPYYDLIINRLMSMEDGALPPEHRHGRRWGSPAATGTISSRIAGRRRLLRRGLLRGRRPPGSGSRVPSLEMLRLDTEESSGEVFWADRGALARL